MRRERQLMRGRAVRSGREVSVGLGNWMGRRRNVSGRSLVLSLLTLFDRALGNRGITMDVALQSLETPHRHITILDAPGHKDFIPNMISGASQADCALLVVDASTGEFEAGFERGGQTREHLVLVRSLGVAQVVVAVNKLDQVPSTLHDLRTKNRLLISDYLQVGWASDRYEDVCSQLKPFLLQSGFHSSKTRFVPVGAMAGVNLLDHESDEAKNLRAWYSGPTLVDLLGNSSVLTPIFTFI